MMVRSHTNIKLLEDTKAYPYQYRKTLPAFQDKHAVIIPKYEVVTVVESLDSSQQLLVKNILDEELLISENTLYKIVGKSSNKTQVKADLLDLASLGLGLNKKAKNTDSGLPKGNRVRAVQKMQTIASNVMSTEDISSLARLTVAALCANMSINSGIDAIQSNKLQTYCTKLIGSIN